jgi:hypothetical protein
MSRREGIVILGMQTIDSHRTELATNCTSNVETGDVTEPPIQGSPEQEETSFAALEMQKDCTNVAVRAAMAV